MFASWFALVVAVERRQPPYRHRAAGAVAVVFAIAFITLAQAALDGSAFLRSGAAALGAYG
ncbi:MAG: hypothetical protein ACOYLS_01425 [Polymorphobacter sp.]